MSYQSQLKNHLGDYKVSGLGIADDGFWREKPYPHILPKEHYKLNILETVRDDFWDYYESQNAFKMHRNFYHLNSSQAMCFNLFYPFIMDDNRYLEVLLDTLELPRDDVSEVSLEKVIDKTEGKKFNFYIGYESGVQILFEVKLHESGFGSTRGNEERNRKFEQIYKKRMRKIISNRFQNRMVFFKNYQLIRNLTYLGYTDQTHLFFIIPFENKALEAKTAELIHFLLDGKFKGRVNIGSLENLVSALIERCEAEGIDRLKKHFEAFKKKYIILSKESAKLEAPNAYPKLKKYRKIIWK